MRRFSAHTHVHSQFRLSIAGLAAIILLPSASLVAQGHGKPAFDPGNLVVSRTVYDNLSSNVTVGELLPPNCLASTGGCAVAINDGTFPYVFNNDTADGSFGITSRIFLDRVTPSGNVMNTVEVPNSLDPAVTGNVDHLVTSFSSKSELALNLSTDGSLITFMGYVAPVNTLDVSNSNTPDAFDATNPVPSYAYRAAATVDRWGNFTFTETNAYSGNNGRAAVLNNTYGNPVFYTAGNAGNGGSPQPQNVVLGAGAQIFNFVNQSEANQTPGLPTPVASFSVSELGDKADKVGKDDNFRGLTVFNNVVYFTKGSGSNGVNTVYFIDTTGKACANGVGLPTAGASLPTSPLTYTLPLPAAGLPNNMCILKGFPTTSNKSVNPVNFPFGIWFADDHTLYVADEGDGYTGGADLYAHAAAQTLAGLEKWVLDDSTGQWQLAYTLTNGLGLGTSYTVAGYPTGENTVTGLPWFPAADGLRNITGRVENGTATIYAITSTVSGNGDTGADPNRLVVIQDELSNTSTSGAAQEKFRTIRTAGLGEVLRGVSFGPNSGNGN